MSHVVQIDSVPIIDIPALRAAVEELGGKLVDKKTYNWFGMHVGDYPMPKGMTQDDLGKCEMVAQFPFVNYECGFRKTEDGLVPIFDFYGSGGAHDGQMLQKKIGDGAGKLMQLYSKHALMNACTAQGYMIESMDTDQDGNLQVSINTY
jgi:hypothetical protein